MATRLSNWLGTILCLALGSVKRSGAIVVLAILCASTSAADSPAEDEEWQRLPGGGEARLLGPSKSGENLVVRLEHRGIDREIWSGEIILPDGQMFRSNRGIGFA